LQERITSTLSTKFVANEIRASGVFYKATMKKLSIRFHRDWLRCLKKGKSARVMGNFATGHSSSGLTQS